MGSDNSDQQYKQQDRGSRCLQKSKPCRMELRKAVGIILGRDNGPKVEAITSRRA